jgi:hypothetical protein
MEEDGSFLLETPKCTSHKGPDWLMCSDCYSWSMPECLIRSETRNNNELVLLESNFEKYCSVWNPALIMPRTKYKTKIQNHFVK